MLRLFLLLLVAVLGCLARDLQAVGRFITDVSTGDRLKLRCVNWAGHLETNIPEGLQHQSVDDIAAFVHNAGFNCVRLTYSIDMALSPDTPVSSSFAQAGVVSGAGENALTATYQQALGPNPWLSSATLHSTFAHVIDSLAAHQVDVILDNHVSKAQWCCNLTDGNGWWDKAAGYTALTSRYFNTSNWLRGLSNTAAWSAQFPNVIGMSVRNEIRSIPPQNLNFEADWYTFVGQGADAIHAANPALLVMIGGVLGALDFSFQRTVRPFDRSALDDKAVWEYHIYSYSPGYLTGECDLFEAQMGGTAGYLLTEGQPYTGPLWLSEFGFGMTEGAPAPGGGLDAQDSAYLKCLVSWLEGNDADWAVWALQGSYYVREGVAGSEETYGVLNADWSGFRTSAFKDLLGGIWNVTQGPGVSLPALSGLAAQKKAMAFSA